MLTRFKNFLIRDRSSILTDAEYKRIMLTGYLSAVCIVVTTLYATLDLINGIYHAFPAYAFLLVTPIISLLLIRNGRYTLAKLILMGNSALAIFYIALLDPPGTGVYMLFIPAGTGAFAILGFQDRFKGLMLATFSSVLFFLAYFGDFNITPPVIANPNYIQISFVTNYAISLIITVAIVFFMIILNEGSERELRQREQSEREKNDQLQKVNTELDRFVYSVSHDLRSPLSSISGLVNIARKSSSVTELQQYIELIAGRVNAQQGYINDIIDFYKNDRANIKSENFSLHSLIKEVVEETSYIQNADQLHFKIEIDDDVNITSDRARLKSVMANLLSNAIKYHAYHKKEKFIRIKAFREGATATILVEDNGNGIAAEHLDKIFDMFYRASHDAKGSGLGLYIVKEIVKKLQGSIIASSTEGEGTSFTISLPA